MNTGFYAGLFAWLKRENRIMKREKFKNELMKEIFSIGTSQVLTTEAKKKIGKKRYDWLLQQFGPAKIGRSADLAEKGDFIFKISAVTRAIKAAEETLKFPTSWQMEEVKRIRKFKILSFCLSTFSALIFFFIGAIPFQSCEILSIKILLIFLGLLIIWCLHSKLFSILEKIR